MTKPNSAFNDNDGNYENMSTDKRFARIKEELLSTPMYLCPERAYLINEYFKKHDDSAELMGIRNPILACHTVYPICSFWLGVCLD